MKFREGIYLVGISCFCGLSYLFVASLLGIPSRSRIIPIESPSTFVESNSKSKTEALLKKDIVKPETRAQQIANVLQYPKENNLDQESSSSRNNVKKDYFPEIVIAVVACGGKEKIVQQTMTMIKSAVLFSKRNRLKIIGFTDENTRDLFTEKILEILVQGQKYLGDSKRLSIEIHPTWFPKENDWIQLYAPCSAQRLFLPTMLPNVDALLYMDSDTLVLNDLYYLWNYFKLMNSVQYVGMVPEHELPGSGWYDKEATFPYYGSRGLNAGVILMNLTRMRNVNFQDKMIPILTEYNGQLPWGDQDILNIFLHNRTEVVYQLPCQYNYRMNHCKCDYNDNKSCTCASADEDGVSIFHGNKGIFFKDYPSYKIPSILYQAFRKHNLLNGTPRDLIHNLYKNIHNISSASKKAADKSKTQPSSSKQECTNLELILLKNLREYTDEYELEDHDDEDPENNDNIKNGEKEQFLDFSIENKLEFIE